MNVTTKTSLLFFVIFISFCQCSVNKKDRKFSNNPIPTFLYKDYINDEKLISMYQKFSENGNIDSATIILKNIRSVDFLPFANSTLASIYYDKKKYSDAKNYYLRYLTSVGVFPEKIDTSYCSEDECGKYLQKRNPEMMELIKNISERDQKFRSNDRYKQAELDHLNFKEFNEYVANNGWPTISKTGNDRSVGTFSAFLHHLPDELKIMYLDSCIFYAQKGLEGWRRCEVLTSKLIIDKSLNGNIAITSFCNNCDLVIDDLELMEIYSIIKNSIKSNKRIQYIIEYEPSQKEIGSLFYTKSLELFPKLEDQIKLREKSGSNYSLINENSNTCLSFKIEKI